MVRWTGDPEKDFALHDAEQEAWLQSLPVCDYCNEEVQDDFYYEINDEVVCEKCLVECFRKDVDDYVQ